MNWRASVGARAFSECTTSVGNLMSRAVPTGIERNRVRQIDLHGEAIDVLRHGAARCTVELVGFAQRHGDVAAIRGNRWNGLRIARSRDPRSAARPRSMPA